MTDSTEAFKAEDALPRIKFQKDLSGEELSQCRELLDYYTDISSTSDTDMGTTDKVKHRIELSEATLINQTYRRINIPPSLVD